MELDRALDAYLRHLTIERGLSANTLGAYERDLRRYREWLGAEAVTDTAEITAEQVSRFAAEQASAEPAPAASSLSRLQSSVRGWHRYLVREGIDDADPAEGLRPPKLPRRLPKALTIDETLRLLAAPSAEEPLGIRDRALLELLYATGARVSEAVGLDVDDVSHGEVLRVRGKGDKERIVPLGSYARAALDAYLTRVRPSLSTRGRGTAKLFLGARGAPLSRQSAWLVIREAAERAQIERDVSPHTLRHSFATHLLQGGADVRVVQELLGHATVATTQIYTAVSVDALRDVYITAHPRAR